jgi:hypothetical protein
MKTTTTNVTRWAGLAAIAAGGLFIGIQLIHPIDVIASVTTGRWAIVHFMGVAMCLLSLAGITGIYARQVEEAGWLGLVGFLLAGLFWAFTLCFQFAEAFFSPVLATAAPKFVEGFLGIVTGHAGEIDLGLLPAVHSATGILYIASGLLFGIATFRAGVLPRWAGALLAFAAVAPLAAPLVGHPFDRVFAVPMGLALTWLGYAVWFDRRKRASQPVVGKGSPQRQARGEQSPGSRPPRRGTRSTLAPGLPGSLYHHESPRSSPERCVVCFPSHTWFVPLYQGGVYGRHRGKGNGLCDARRAAGERAAAV